MKQAKSLGHEIDENGIKPNEEKGRNHVKTECTGEYKRIEIISRSDTIYGKIPTETLGKNRSVPQLIEEKMKHVFGEPDKMKISETLNRC